MSEERKPLLSDPHELLDEEHFNTMFFRRSFSDDEMWAANKIIDFYENLITTGKLRVVEEVEMKGNDYDCLLQCTGCNWGIGWHIEEDLEPMKFCPGCGNPIKR